METTILPNTEATTVIAMKVKPVLDGILPSKATLNGFLSARVKAVWDVLRTVSCWDVYAVRVLTVFSLAGTITQIIEWGKLASFATFDTRISGRSRDPTLRSVFGMFYGMIVT